MACMIVSHQHSQMPPKTVNKSIPRGNLTTVIICTCRDGKWKHLSALAKQRRLILVVSNPPLDPRRDTSNGRWLTNRTVRKKGVCVWIASVCFYWGSSCVTFGWPRDDSGFGLQKPKLQKRRRGGPGLPWIAAQADWQQKKLPANSPYCFCILFPSIKSQRQLSFYYSHVFAQRGCCERRQSTP